jgi:hypothetical protein
MYPASTSPLLSDECTVSRGELMMMVVDETGNSCCSDFTIRGDIDTWGGINCGDLRRARLPIPTARDRFEEHNLARAVVVDECTFLSRKA